MSRIIINRSLYSFEFLNLSFPTSRNVDWSKGEINISPENIKVPEIYKILFNTMLVRVKERTKSFDDGLFLSNHISYSMCCI